MSGLMTQAVACIRIEVRGQCSGRWRKKRERIDFSLCFEMTLVRIPERYAQYDLRYTSYMRYTLYDLRLRRKLK